MILFCSRHPTIGGPRAETWRALCHSVAPRPIYYTTRTVFYGGVQSMRERNVQITGGGGGYIPSSGYSFWDMLLVVGATIAGTVAPYVLLTWLAKVAGP